MILKASQRGGGQDLAVHLMRLDDNEHVSLHELRGFAADDLKGAFKEAEAVSRGTKCDQYLFSLSLNPPEQEHVPIEAFETAIARIEERLGLQGQPRAIVIHEKESRRHCHCVWSRIDPETMTARQLSFFKTKLQGVSRELYLENGWKLPRGLENAAERNPTNFTLAEWQQAKRQEIDPRWLKSTLQGCWQRSDNAQSFQRALQDRGFFVARGDKRGYVVLDHQGEVWSLPKLLDLKTKDVRARLGSGEDLPSVAQVQKTVGERMVPSLKAHIAESRARFAERSETLSKYKSEMTQLHREARAKLTARQEAQWREETIQRAARLPKGLRGLWHRITGKYQQIRRENEAEAQATRERQAKERDALIAKQLEQRAVLQTHFKELRRRQAEELLALRADIGRFLSITRSESARTLAPGASLSLKLQR
jgi:hypothetical protein